MSANPFKIKYSNSLIKRPLPPMSDKDLFKILSPDVVTLIVSVSTTSPVLNLIYNKILIYLGILCVVLMI